MTASVLSRAASANRDFRYDVSSVALGGWPSNLLLNMHRIDAASAH
jgi:hypothetical protein